MWLVQGQHRRHLRAMGVGAGTQVPRPSPLAGLQSHRSSLLSFSALRDSAPARVAKGQWLSDPGQSKAQIPEGTCTGRSLSSP